MSQPEWSLQLYEQQHEIWPGWSASAAGSDAAMDLLVRWLGLEPGMRVLDLGCGVGRELVALARRGLRPTGLELSAKLVARARARVEAAEVDARVVEGDLLAADLAGFAPGSFDLLMAWDSTLNIFPLATSIAALERWLPSLARGGWICIEQLHDRHWQQSFAPVVLAGAEIGPGRTIRRYRFEQGRLYDEVVHEPEQGPARTLPTQVLHLYPVEELEAALRGLGLVDVGSIGSTGSAWREPGPPRASSAMLLTRGRLP